MTSGNTEKEVKKTAEQLLEEQTIILRQMDWKLWTITNALCDALLAKGLLEKDPRL